MDISIYVLGNIDFTYRILVAINMLYQSQAMHLMAGILLILFVFWTFIKWALNPQNSPYPFREFAFGIIFYMIFGGIQYISPRVDVQLETDTYNGTTYQTRTVADLPILAVAPAWIMTNLFRGLRDTLAPLLYIPGEMSGAGYPGVGSGIDPLAVLIDTNDMSMGITPSLRFPYLEKSIKQYMTDCFIPFHSFNGSPTDPDYSILLNAPVANIWSQAAVNVNWLQTKYYDSANKSGIEVDCFNTDNTKNAHHIISTALDSDMKPALTNYLSGLQLSATDLQNSMGLVYNSFTGATLPNPYDFMVGKFASTYMAQILVESPTTMMSNKMMFESAQRRVFERAGESNLFVQVMVPIITAIESFAFFIAPLLMLFTVFGGAGLAYLGKYLMLTLFINLWGFIKIFTDFFMLLVVHLNFSGDLSTATEMDPFSFTNQYSTYMELENFLSIASSLTVAIPMFAMFLLYGGVHSLMGVMRTMSSGSVDAANVAPNIATSYSGGKLDMGDSEHKAIVSTSTFAGGNSPPSSAKYVDENTTEQSSMIRQQMLNHARNRELSSITSLNNSLGHMFTVGNGGSQTWTEADKESTTVSTGIRTANSLAEDMNQQYNITQSEQGQNVSRLAAAFALQLKSQGMSKTDYDKLSETEQSDFNNKLKKGLGIGMDVNLQGITQFTEGGSEGFSKRVQDTLNYINSEDSGAQYSKGFDFSTAKQTSETAHIGYSAAKMQSNVESIKDARVDQKQIQNSVSENTNFSTNKQIRWNALASVLAEKGGQDEFSKFDYAFSRIDASTQADIMRRNSANNVSDLYTNLLKENSSSDAVHMIKGLADDLKGIQNFDAAAGVYSGMAPLVGEYSEGFNSAARNLRAFGDIREDIDNNQVRVGAAMPATQAQVGDSDPTNIQAQSGQVPGTAEVQKRASGIVEQSIGNQGVVNLAHKSGLNPQEAGTPLKPNFDNGVKIDSEKISSTFSESQAKWDAKDNVLDNMDPLKGINQIMPSVLSGVDNVVDFIMGPDQAWGKNAESWSETVSATANAQGYHSSELQSGLKNLLEMDNPKFVQLHQDLARGKHSAFEKLSELNDARLFLMNTGQDGRAAMGALGDEDQKALAVNIETLGAVMQTLPNDSPISQEEMNEISRARLQGDITDQNAQNLVILALGGDETIGTSLFGYSNDLKSTLYSAANGNIAQNEVLLGIVERSSSADILSQIKVGEPQYAEVDEPQSNTLFIGDSPQTERGRLLNPPSEMAQEYQDAFVRDVVFDNIAHEYQGALVTTDNQFVSGINKELPSLDKLQGQALFHLHGALNTSMSDSPSDWNDNYLDGANGLRAFGFDTGITWGSEYKQGYVLSSLNIDAQDITRGLGNLPQAELINQTWTDLQDKAKYFGFGIEAEIYNASYENLETSSTFVVDPNQKEIPPIGTTKPSDDAKK